MANTSLLEMMGRHESIEKLFSKFVMRLQSAINYYYYYYYFRLEHVKLYLKNGHFSILISSKVGTS